MPNARVSQRAGGLPVKRIADISDLIPFYTVAAAGRRAVGAAGKGKKRGQSDGWDTQFNRRNEWLNLLVPVLGGHYLCDRHEDKQNNCVVRDHEAVFTEEVSKNGEGMFAALVPGSVPFTEVHGVGVIDHVWNQKPDILSGKPVPERKHMGGPRSNYGYQL